MIASSHRAAPAAPSIETAARVAKEAATERPERIRIIHVDASRSRLATVRDLAIILLCAALLLGTLAEVLLAARSPEPPAPARARASVSM